MGLDIVVYQDGKRIKSFRAGSYSGYNHWRNRLAQLALNMTDHAVWAKQGKVKAFGRLIHFSDCEGTIDTVDCAALAQDFDNYAEEIKAKLDLTHPDNAYNEDAMFWHLYQEWQDAFNTAKQNGELHFR